MFNLCSCSSHVTYDINRARNSMQLHLNCSQKYFSVWYMFWQKCYSDLLNGLFQSLYDMGKDHLPRKVKDGIEKMKGLPSHLFSMTFYKIGIHQRIKWRNWAGHKIFLYSPKIKLEDCEETHKTQWLLQGPALLEQSSKIVFLVLTDEICLLCQCQLLCQLHS